MSQSRGLIQKIVRAQNNKSILLKMINDFALLNQKYANRLGYDDAMSDMQLDFICIIQNLDADVFSPKKDPYVLGYINRSIYNAYTKHAKRFNILYNQKSRKARYTSR